MTAIPVTQVATPQRILSAARPAKEAVRAVTSPIDSPASWLANAATLALHLLPEDAITLAAVAVRDESESNWSPLAIGIGGTSDHEFARRLDRITRLSVELGNRSGPFISTDAPDIPTTERSTAPDQSSVAMCAYLGSRRTLGLHAMARARARLSVPSPMMMLVIQADGKTPQWEASSDQADALAEFCEAVAIGYANRFVVPKRRQESLLNQLSQTQRRIVPLLVQEKSEREIADVLSRSRHTIHEHVKAIYQTWGVHSRHQARELWIGRTTGP